jgi:hypothetical protein
MVVPDSSPGASVRVSIRIPQMLTLADGTFLPPLMRTSPPTIHPCLHKIMLSLALLLVPVLVNLIIKNHGQDRKGEGLAQAGFGLQKSTIL